jgi:hypothetical protein
MILRSEAFTKQDARGMKEGGRKCGIFTFRYMLLVFHRVSSMLWQKSQ